jgi:hypothetical protein
LNVDELAQFPVVVLGMAFKRTNAGKFPVRYNVHIQMNDIFVPRLL